LLAHPGDSRKRPTAAKREERGGGIKRETKDGKKRARRVGRGSAGSFRETERQRGRVKRPLGWSG